MIGPLSITHIELSPFSILLKDPGRLKILPKFSWVDAQFKHDCAISENRAEKLGGKKSWKFSTFKVGFLNWNFNSQSDFVLVLTTAFFNMAILQRDETWNLSRIFGLCHMEFSFSRTILSVWWESTTASSLVTSRSSCPEVF